MLQHLTLETTLPTDHAQAVLIGRIWVPGSGPVLVRVQADGITSLEHLAATTSQLLDLPDAAAQVHAQPGTYIADTAAVLANSAFAARNPALPWLLAPCDLQALKAAGVTFVASMLERVIEEQARGDASKAVAVRAAVVAVIGDNLSNIQPGSPAGSPHLHPGTHPA